MICLSHSNKSRNFSRIALLVMIFWPFCVAANGPLQDATSKQDTLSYWKTNAAFGLQFNQLSLSNWSAGGESSVSGKATVDYKLVYMKDKQSFDFQHKSMFGVVGYGERRIEKTEDRLDFATSYSLQASRQWKYSALITFKSQFANGYKYPNDSTLISAFMAPGYLTASLGFRYVKTEHFSFFLSPASGKFTFVCNQELADKGAFGVTKAVIDSIGNIIEPGHNLLPEFGINVYANYNQSLSENIDLATNLTLYNNYLDPNKSNRWNIDVDWETTLNFSINKSIQTVLYLILKYDHNIDIPIYEVIDGVKQQTGLGPRLQFKESLGIGLTYKLG